MLQKNSSDLQHYPEAIQHEWLETNGLGGWSSSSIIGCHTRRYHGLLVAATVPPTERMSLLSKLDETIMLNGERFDLGTNNYNGTVHPQGFRHATSFTKDLFPVFTYTAVNITLTKTIAMVHEANTVLILYHVARAASPFRLELLPLLSVRGYHQLMLANDHINQHASFDNSILVARPYESAPQIYISAPGSSYEAAPNWYYNFTYAIEAYRGLDSREDLFSPGKLSIELKEGTAFGIIVSADNPMGKDAFELFKAEEKRRLALLKGRQVNDITRQLILAADQFIVKRGEALKTVIAGYHWFTDWGRDTMISLPGLTLCTGRFDDARKILSAFAQSVSQGMLPNRFQDNGEPPEYNTVDGTLWYFVAIHKYLEATGDSGFVLNELLPVLKEIVHWHVKGTRFNIHAEESGLLFAGEAGQQLTWMDARIGGWVVTARMGKPVEIQALWYNALKIFAALLQMNNELETVDNINTITKKIQQNFTQEFWFAAGGYLYDCIDENNHPVDELRPNQLFAISLPYPLIEGEKAKSVVEKIEKELYTPTGLRTLPVADFRYNGVYGGSPHQRDAAYHQGTVWSWLLGPYADAVMRAYGSREKLIEIVNQFAPHLTEGCIGSVAEIFDADPPHHPRGCAAQAWGVAEILRIITEYGLQNE